MRTFEAWWGGGGANAPRAPPPGYGPDMRPGSIPGRAHTTIGSHLMEV